MVLREADAKAKFLAYKSRQHEARSAEEKKREAEVKGLLEVDDRISDMDMLKYKETRIWR